MTRSIAMATPPRHTKDTDKKEKKSRTGENIIDMLQHTYKEKRQHRKANAHVAHQVNIC